MKNKETSEKKRFYLIYIALLVPLLFISVYFGDSLNFFNSSNKNISLDTTINGIVVKKPVENCRVYFSGGIVCDSTSNYGLCTAFKLDSFSEYVGQGNYPQNSKAFPKAVKSTFDGIAIGKDTRVIIYEYEDFKGEVLLDLTGPFLINNIIWKDDPKYKLDLKRIFNKKLKGKLNKLFPTNRRIYSESNMHNWSYGSLKILCSDHEDFLKKLKPKIKLNINTAMVIPSKIHGKNYIKENETTNLSILDGDKGTNGNWVWYKDNCGDLMIGTGSSIDVTPIKKTTTYFVRAEENTNYSDCISFTVNVSKTYSEPERTVSEFLEALGNKDFIKAHSLQQIPRLGNQNEFSSTNRFGGIYQINIIKIKEISNNIYNAQVEVQYEAFDSDNSDKNISQIFTVTKTNNNWIITELKTLLSNEI